MTFEDIIKENRNINILQIEQDGTTIARGIHIQDAVLTFEDNNPPIVSYPDTGVFVLFVGSQSTSVDEKYHTFLAGDGTTSREIVFQSRNAAAKFVLGESGRTNSWK